MIQARIHVSRFIKKVTTEYRSKMQLKKRYTRTQRYRNWNRFERNFKECGLKAGMRLGHVACIRRRNHFLNTK
jgi:hypothetical protein